MLCQSNEPYVPLVIDETLTEFVVDMVREGILQREAIGTRGPAINQDLWHGESSGSRNALTPASLRPFICKLWEASLLLRQGFGGPGSPALPPIDRRARPSASFGLSRLNKLTFDGRRARLQFPLYPRRRAISFRNPLNLFEGAP
jgi:hypothetical protein